MSGGIFALKGFKYQDIVILDLILKYFYEVDENIKIRPEGEDDLVIHYQEQSIKDFFQIKKPRENVTGERTYKKWSLTEIVHEVLHNTINNIEGTSDKQYWILGDQVDPSVKKLLELVTDKRYESTEYLKTLHLLARDKSKILNNIDSGNKNTLNRWKPVLSTDNTFMDNIISFFTDFIIIAKDLGANKKSEQNYVNAIKDFDLNLPTILSRIELQDNYGTDDEYLEKIEQKLYERFALDKNIISKTLKRNLLWYIQDISTQKDRWIDKEEFTLEICNVWPKMTLVHNTPQFPKNYIKRKDLLVDVNTAIKQGAVEIIGVSGSGKTSFSREIIENFKKTNGKVIALYLEVRRDNSFRDVLTGIAYYLLRYKIKTPFQHIINYNTPSQDLIEEMAGIFSEINIPCLALVDLTEGYCNDTFAKDLADFLRILSNNKKFTLIVQGQESSFKYISLYDREAYGIPNTIDFYGFNFEEFKELYLLQNPSISDVNKLHFVFAHLTAGRITGMPARLADTLSTLSLAELLKVKDSNPNDILEKRDKERYQSFKNKFTYLQETVDKLLCFIIPFEGSDAQRIFQEDRISEAIQELRDVGLLHEIGNNRYEFHETIRKGLITLIPESKKIKYNKILYNLYLSEGNTIAAIMHLEQSGEIKKAHDLARKTFLTGENLSAIIQYIIKNNLVTINDILSLLRNHNSLKDPYLLADLIKATANDSTPDELMKILIKRNADPSVWLQWEWIIIKSILMCDKNRIYDLIIWGVKHEDNGRYPRLDYISIEMKSIDSYFDIRIINFFNKQTENLKFKLSPILMKCKNVEILKVVLKFLLNYSGNIIKDWGIKSIIANYFKNGETFKLFLASLPIGDPKEMLFQKSVLLNNFEYYFWLNQHNVKKRCLEILKNENDKILINNAIRILLLLGDSRVIRYIEKKSQENKELISYQFLLPFLFPENFDFDKYRKILLNKKNDLASRITAFYSLYCTDEFNSIFDELIQIDEENTTKWNYLYLIQVTQYPRKRALTLFRETYKTINSEKECVVSAPLLVALGELEGDEVNDFFISLIDSPWESIRIFVYLFFINRRCKKAYPHLLKKYKEEIKQELIKVSIQAIMASSPEKIIDKNSNYNNSDEYNMWLCTLIGRLKDINSADFLVKIACDKNKHWEIRRAAILASAYLPFESVLENIYKSILKESSDFILDKSSSLLGHSIVGNILLTGKNGIMRIFIKGKGRFVQFFGEIFDSINKTYLSPHNITGKEIAIWLYDELDKKGFQKRINAIEDIINNFHIPILHSAIFRALRKTNRIDILERIIESSVSEWLLIRALCEWNKQTNITEKQIFKIKEDVSRNSLSNFSGVENVLKQFSSVKNTKKKNEIPVKNVEVVHLDYKKVIVILDKQSSVPIQKSIILTDINIEQFKDLIEQLHPNNNYIRQMNKYKSNLRFIKDGGYSVGNTSSYSTSEGSRNRERIRCALVAYNKFDIDIPWHDELLKSQYGAERYIHLFFNALADHGNDLLFYKELEYNSEFIIPYFTYNKKIEIFFNKRIIPFLKKYNQIGTDEFLYTLCWIANSFNGTEIDQILTKLFYRWIRRVKHIYSVPNQSEHMYLWKTFYILRKHERLRRIPDYDLRLMELLTLNLRWTHKHDITRLISKCPRAYITFEKELFKTAPFEHYCYDDVNFFDDNANKLFNIDKIKEENQ